MKSLKSVESLDLEKSNSKGTLKSISLIGKKRKMKKQNIVYINNNRYLIILTNYIILVFIIH